MTALMVDMGDVKSDFAPSLDDLEARIRRVTYALTGESEPAKQSSTSNVSPTAAARLRTLERQLQSLAARSQTATEVLRLHKKHPYVFHAATDPALAPDVLPRVALASLVLAHGPMYQRLSAQLDLLKDQSVPDPSSLLSLVELQSRTQRLADKQQEQAKQLAKLRNDSARVLESWYSCGVLGMSERWADWEERMRDVEILVRRMHAAKERESLEEG